MKTIPFDRSELERYLAQHADPKGIAPADQQVYDRLWELYGPKVVYGLGVLACGVLEQPVGGSPRDTALWNIARCPVAVFRGLGRRTGNWVLSAVFKVSPVPDPDQDRTWYEFYARFGVEYVAIPWTHVTNRYLFSRDFGGRSRRAIYAPLKTPFRVFPKIPPGGWPIVMPAPSSPSKEQEQ